MNSKFRHIAARIIGALAIVLLSIMFVLQIPAVQTNLAQFAVSKLDGKIDGRISLSAIKIIPPGTVVLKDLVIIDNSPLAQPDTFFFAETIAASLKWNWMFAGSGIALSKVKVDKGGMVLVSEPNQYRTNLGRIFGIIPPTVPAEPTKGTVFSIGRVRVEDFHFRLKDRRYENEYSVPYGLDFANLDLQTTVIGHDMHFTQGVMYATCDHCNIRSNSCDYTISSITGNCRVGQGMTLVSNIHLIDNWSNLNLASFSMEYRKRHGIREFATEVKVGAVMDKGHLALQTIKQFVHIFDGNPIDLDLTGGNVYGYLYDLGINNLEFHDRYSGLSGTIDGRLTGLPDTDKFGISARLIDFNVTADGFGKFLSAFSTGKAIDLSGIAPGQNLTINAEARGLMNKLRAEINIDSPSGQLQAKAKVGNLLDMFRVKTIEGSILTDRLDLRGIIKGLPIGELTMGCNISARLNPGKPEFTVDTLAIQKIDLLKGSYNSINATAKIKDRKLNLYLNSEDPNLDLMIDAKATTKENGDINGLKMTADFNNIDLDTLGLLTKVPMNGIRTRIIADMRENDRGIFQGDINIPNVSLRTTEEIVNTGAINLKARYGASTQRIHLTSKILDAAFVGSDAPSAFVRDLKAITTDVFLPALAGTAGQGSRPEDNGRECGNYTLGLNFHQTAEVLETFVPGIQVADSTKLRLNIQDGKLRGSLASSAIALKGISARKVDMSFDNMENGISAYILSKEVRLGKIRFKKATTSVSAKDDRVDIRLKYDNSNNKGSNLANLNFDCGLSRDRNDTLLVSITPYSSFFNFNNRRWDLKGMTMLRGGSVLVDNISIKSGKNSFNLYGGIGFSKRDTLMVDARNFELAFLDNLMGLEMKAEGNLNGHGLVSLPFKRKEDLDVDLTISNTSIGEARLGDFELEGDWDSDKQMIVASFSNTSSGAKSISAHANYTPHSKKLEGNIKLDRLNLGVAKPFLSNVLSDIGGYVSGDFQLHGSKGQISMTEHGACLQDAMVKIAFTGVQYIINGDLDIEAQRIGLNQLSIRDMDKGTGNLSGQITFGKEGLKMNIGLDFDDLKLIDTPQKQGLPIYGTVLASGKVGVAGSAGAMKISADLKADKRGDIHVPLNTALVSNSNDLLTFVSQIEYGKEELAAQQATKSKNQGSKLELNARARISPELTAWVEIDKTTGNKMTVKGDGDISLAVNSASGKTSLNGAYTIHEGDYHFVVPGLLEKDFDIKNGSTVTLTGDVSDTRLDIKAGHPVRASISTLLADTSAVGNRRLIDCIIGINGNLKAPKLSFDIDIPEVDPTTQAQIASALNTEDKRQKQFMSLLLLGSFMPAEESGVINGTNMLYSNVGEIMSGQVNNIMQKLDIPLDFGFGYQQSMSGGDMYDVAVSTQLFNNRVIVNGSVGSRQNKGSTSQSDIVGDIEVSVKLDKYGQWRASAFSHPANEYTSFLDNSQRSGVGVSYQKEFNKLKDLFTSRKKLEAEALKEKKRKIIKVQ